MIPERTPGHVANGSDNNSSRSGAGKSEDLAKDPLRRGIYDMNRSRQGDMSGPGEIKRPQ